LIMTTRPEGTRGGMVPKYRTPSVGVSLKATSTGAAVPVRLAAASALNVDVGWAVGALVLVAGGGGGVSLGTRVAVGRIASVSAAEVAPSTVAVARTSTLGVGLTACCKKVGIQALRASERINVSRSDLLMAQLLMRKNLVLGGDFHELIHDVT
jgi:hypothetical protein